ncbi:MAG: glycosyltransferase family 39 protein [Chlamydiota bacterium]|nr:glycosyltransferase family 39 protein [Chlamydiota bacterium]
MVYKNIWRGILVACILWGAFFFFYQLGRQSLWHDEILSATHSQLSLKEIIFYKPPANDLAHHAHPVLHYILLHLALILGSSDFFVRLPSAIFGLLLIPLGYFTGKRMVNLETGVLTAFLFALSKAVFAFSQEARMYSQFAFFSLFSLYFLYGILFEKKAKKSDWIGFTCFSVLNFHTHSFAILVLGVEMMGGALILGARLLYREKRKSALIHASLLWLCLGVIAVLAAPELLKPHNLIFQHQHGLVIAPGVRFDPKFFMGIIDHFSANSWFFTKIYMGLFIAGLLINLFRKPSLFLIFILWICVPFLALFHFKASHFFNIRYIVFILPVYLLVIATGISELFQVLQKGLARIHPACRSIKVVLILSIIFMGFIIRDNWAIYQASFVYEKDNWRAAGAYLNDHVQDGDLVYANHLDTLSVSYYFHTKEHHCIQLETEEAIRKASPHDFWFVSAHGEPFHFLDQYKIIDHQRFKSLQVNIYHLQKFYPIQVTDFRLSASKVGPGKKIHCKISLNNPDPWFIEVRSLKVLIYPEGQTGASSTDALENIVLYPQQSVDLIMTLDAPLEEGRFDVRLISSSAPFVFYPLSKGFYLKGAKIVNDAASPFYFTVHFGADDTHMGILLYGPYMRVPEGHYQAMFIMKTGSVDQQEPLAMVDVVADKGGLILGKAVIDQSLERYQAVKVDFTIEEAKQIEFRLHKLVKGDVFCAGVVLNSADPAWMQYYQKDAQFYQLPLIVNGEPPLEGDVSSK